MRVILYYRNANYPHPASVSLISRNSGAVVAAIPDSNADSKKFRVDISGEKASLERAVAECFHAFGAPARLGAKAISYNELSRAVQDYSLGMRWYRPFGSRDVKAN